RVVVGGNGVGGECYYCRRDFPYFACENMTDYGNNLSAATPPHLFGGWAEYMYIVPGSFLVRGPAELPSEIAVFTEVMAGSGGLDRGQQFSAGPGGGVPFFGTPRGASGRPRPGGVPVEGAPWGGGRRDHRGHRPLAVPARDGEATGSRPRGQCAGHHAEGPARLRARADPRARRRRRHRMCRRAAGDPRGARAAPGRRHARGGWELL